LSHNAHRFSLEWSRIEPEEGKFDKGALDHYREVIKNLRTLGIEPVVTINHFTLPLWLSEREGWLCKRSEYKFVTFVKKITEVLGNQVTYWITLNEPAVNIYYSYIEGTWPPGHRSFKEAVRVFIKLLRTHSLAYKAIHRIYKEKKWPTPKVSVAKNILSLAPCRKASIGDAISAKARHYYFNKLFIDSLIKGRCIAPGMPPVILPAKRTLDFIGINYYTRDFVHYAGMSPVKIFGDICTLRHHGKAGKRNFLKWEIYPRGIYDILMEYSAYKVPLMITENGICTNNDNERIDFIKEHIQEVARALKDGAPVCGYLYWSLVDNFEWVHGYEPRFGLIDIDYRTKRRSARTSARIYSGLIKKSQ
jgi:beta-glucosidase